MKAHESKVMEMAEENIKMNFRVPLALVSKDSGKEVGSDVDGDENEEGFPMNSNDKAMTYYSDNSVKNFYKNLISGNFKGSFVKKFGSSYGGIQKSVEKAVEKKVEKTNKKKEQKTEKKLKGEG